MAWECAECHSAESSSVNVNAVCHHCGRLLCQGDQIVFPDPAFAVGRESPSAEAVHCRECTREHHPVLGHLGTVAR
jgi:hypothetical protein